VKSILQQKKFRRFLETISTMDKSRALNAIKGKMVSLKRERNKMNYQLKLVKIHRLAIKKTRRKHYY
jgi:hypothetical protein